MSALIDPQLPPEMVEAAAVSLARDNAFSEHCGQETPDLDDRLWARHALEAAGVPALLTQLADESRRSESYLAQLQSAIASIGEEERANDLLRGELESLRTALRDLYEAEINDRYLWDALETARIALAGVPEPPESCEHEVRPIYPGTALDVGGWYCTKCDEHRPNGRMVTDPDASMWWEYLDWDGNITSRSWRAGVPDPPQNEDR